MFRFFLIFTALLCFVIPANADLPHAKVVLKNIKYKQYDPETKEKISLQRKWFQYLNSHEESLHWHKSKQSKYKYDQRCRFIIKNTKPGQFSEIDFDSIELDKHNKNYAYNLMVIDFLKQQPLRIKAQNKDKPMKIELKYYAY